MAQKRGWLLPIDIMIDLQAMRKFVPVVTVAQYLTLNGLPIELETKNGAWDRHAYHSTTDGRAPPSLAVIMNDEYDHGLHGIMRVDRLPPGDLAWTPRLGSKESKVHDALLKLLNKQNVAGLDVVRAYLKDFAHEQWSDKEMTTILRKYGFSLVYTYAGLYVPFLPFSVLVASPLCSHHPT